MNTAKEHVLENNIASLIPLSTAHIDDFIRISEENQGLLKFSPSEFDSTEAVRKYVNTALKARSTAIRYPFTIIDKKTHKIAGSTSFGNISPLNKRIEIGWTWISKEFQRTGLNRNCKFLLLYYAFERLAYDRVELKTDARNTQSRTAIKRIGAKYEGELRSHTLMHDGHRRNTVYYSILKNEWPDIKSSIFKDCSPMIF